MNLSLSRLPWHLQIAAFAGLVVAGVGAFYSYYELPARAEMAAREVQLKALRRDVSKGLATARRLPEFRIEVDELEARLTDLRAVLPEEKDVADLLRRMQILATQSHLVITGFKPAPIVTKDLHAEWPINLELEGNYHNLAGFFDKLGKFTRIVNISGLDIKGNEKSDAATTISAKCVATTFVLMEKPDPPAGKKPGGKGGARKSGAKPAAKKVA